MKIVVTAGPTREHIDDARFLSNPSSGRMGYAFAEVAVEKGHQVILISGPVELPRPAAVDVVKVVSALDMQEAVEAAFADCDCLVMAAAVADYRPATRAAGKMKKTPGPMTLELVRNPDILAEVGARKGKRLLVGFALEAADGEQNALAKLRAKNLDLIVLNSPAAFGAERTDVTILGCAGEAIKLEGATKHEIAYKLLDKICGMRKR